MNDVNKFTRGSWFYISAGEGLPNNWGDLGVFYTQIDDDELEIIEIMRFGDSTSNACGGNPSLADSELVVVAGSSASKLADMGYDAVSLIEGIPQIVTKILSGDIEGAEKDIDYNRIK